MTLPAYLLARLLTSVGAALAVVGSVIMLVDFVEISHTLGGRGDVELSQLVELTLLKSPSIVLLLLPFVFLFGSMGAFVMLNRRGELVAMRAAGVSAWRFILPAAVASFVIGLLSVCVLNPMAAATNARFEEETAALVNGGEAGHAGEVWLRQGDYGGQMVIHANGRVIGNGSIRLKGVSIYIQVVGESGNLEFNRRIEAAEAVLIPGYWRLSNARDARADSPVAFSRWLSVPSTLDPASAMEKFVAPAAVAFWDLPAAVSSAEMAGYSSTAYRLRYQQLLAAPLLLAAMTVLAAMFSLRLLRLGDMVALAASGVTLGFGVFFLNQLCGALGATSVIPVEVAAWAPPTLALLSGVTLLCYTEDG